MSAEITGREPQLHTHTEITGREPMLSQPRWIMGMDIAKAADCSVCVQMQDAMIMEIARIYGIPQSVWDSSR